MDAEHSSRDAVGGIIRGLLSDIADSSIEQQDGDENSTFGQLGYIRHQRGSAADGSDGTAQMQTDDPAGRPNGGGWREGRSPLDFMNQHRLQSLWSCEVCGTKFNSSQALGGHKINSINHKQLLEILKEGNLEQILHAVTRLRPARAAKAEPAGDGRSAKRARLSPMAKMPGYRRVVEGFSQTVQAALEKTQSPASFFSSCSLQVFRRHSKFGRLVDCDLAHGGATAGMAPDEAQEFQVFSRMLQTKKKFLDINRKAVSKRITRIRKRWVLMILTEAIGILSSKKEEIPSQRRILEAPPPNLQLGGQVKVEQKGGTQRERTRMGRRWKMGRRARWRMTRSNSDA